MQEQLILYRDIQYWMPIIKRKKKKAKLGISKKKVNNIVFTYKTVSKWRITQIKQDR